IEDAFCMLRHLAIAVHIPGTDVFDLREQPFFITDVVKMSAVVERATVERIYRHKLHVILATPSEKLEQLIEQIRGRNYCRTGVKRKTISMKDTRPPARLIA